ncbi:MAG: hypothetical protein C0404_09260 [Verrucomicrobia bacterium]|nr:hypothetical protein [Verrucomicrobiota bacterium]
MPFYFEQLEPDRKRIVESIRHSTTKLLDNTPRFKYFTLHGGIHTQNLLKLLDLLHSAGLRLSNDEAFFLLCSICCHDMGMVVPLASLDHIGVFQGREQPADPVHLEKAIRESHHVLVSQYINAHFDFLAECGLTSPECTLVSNIAAGHRVIDLSREPGLQKTLGALLRILDELDVGPTRAPATVLRDHYQEMDRTSCWHWFKHNITADWIKGHTVAIELGGIPKITFSISVHPPTNSSIDYWLHQIRRPIAKVLLDENCNRIIQDQWGIDIVVEQSKQLSCPGQSDELWRSIEGRALAGQRKAILVIDDEVRKMEDLFIPLQRDFHIIFAPTLHDALLKLEAASVDLAIVDMQMGSSGILTPEQTDGYKKTGSIIADMIRRKYPQTQIGILTGSKHKISDVEQRPDLAFFMKKPVDPGTFEKEVRRVLQ